MPHFLNAECLHSNQPKARHDKIMQRIKQGDVDVLLVSPEAIVAGEKSTGFGSLLRDLPPIAFVCIDEAHCMSQWSHNFRPSYLMICRVIREKFKVKTVLGLTATATVKIRYEECTRCQEVTFSRMERWKLKLIFFVAERASFVIWEYRTG